MGTRLAISGYIGLVIYCLLSLFLGPMGIKAYSELESRVAQMGENLKSLESLHEEALARLESARSDPEALALEARSLGYVSNGEVVVRMGFPEADPAPQNLGTLIPCVSPEGTSDAELKTAAIVAALCAFFLSLAVRPPKKSRDGSGREKRAVHGRGGMPRSLNPDGRSGGKGTVSPPISV